MSSARCFLAAGRRPVPSIGEGAMGRETRAAIGWRTFEAFQQQGFVRGHRREESQDAGCRSRRKSRRSDRDRRGPRPRGRPAPRSARRRLPAGILDGPVDRPPEVDDLDPAAQQLFRLRRSRSRTRCGPDFTVWSTCTSRAGCRARFRRSSVPGCGAGSCGRR